MIRYPQDQWIDPRDVDWTDSLNGLAKPGWSLNNDPFVFKALNDDVTLALRNAKGIEARIYVCPDPANQIFAPITSIDYDVPAEPNYHLYAVTASYAPQEGGVDFLVQITDSLTGATIFSSPMRSSDLNPNLPTSPTGQQAGPRAPYTVLETPHLFIRPSYPIVRIFNNNANVTQTCRVTLFGCVEYDL